MKLSRKNWNSYVTRLSAINKTAGKKMQAYISKHGTDDVEALVEYAYGLTSKYGEAASAAVCQMYDEIAAIQKANVPPAEPKPTQHINYVDKAIRSTLDRAPSTVPSTVSEMVKRTGAETTLKNAQRDGAYFAWVPDGDTCAFCLTLASNGWRKASRKTINGDHAEHIHKNCNCEFAISFNGPGQIEGYNPDKYLAMYEGAEGASWKDKVNAMRRVQYAANKDAINAQKRAAYALRKPENTEAGRLATKRRQEEERETLRMMLAESVTIGNPNVDLDIIQSEQFRRKFTRMTGNSSVDDKIRKSVKGILTGNNGTYTETLHIIDADTGETVLRKVGKRNMIGVDLTPEERRMIKEYPGRKIAIHNHPTNIPPTGSDFVTAGVRGYDFGIVATHDGKVYKYTPPSQPVRAATIDEIIDKNAKNAYTDDDKIAGLERARSRLEKELGASWTEL